jgi:hypothetical protein
VSDAENFECDDLFEKNFRLSKNFSRPDENFFTTVNRKFSTQKISQFASSPRQQFDLLIFRAETISRVTASRKKFSSKPNPVLQNTIATVKRPKNIRKTSVKHPQKAQLAFAA